MLAPLLLLSLSPALLSAANLLPGGIKPCKDGADLNECIIKASKEAIKSLAKGDPKTGLPVLDPLIIPKIEQTQGGSRSLSLNFTLENVNITGLSTAELIKSEFDTAKKSLKMTFKVPSYSVISDYTLNGKFLVLPITGKGKSIVNLEDTTIVFSIDYKLEEKKGSKYMSLIPPGKITYSPTKMTFKLENLFNGDKALGDNMNKLINENWKDFNDQVSPGVSQGTAEVMALVFKRITGQIPYNQLIL